MALSTAFHLKPNFFIHLKKLRSLGYGTTLVFEFTNPLGFNVSQVEDIMASSETSLAGRGSDFSALVLIMRVSSSGSSEPMLTPMRTGF